MKKIILPGKLSILCNMAVINIFFAIFKQNNPKIVENIERLGILYKYIL